MEWSDLKPYTRQLGLHQCRHPRKPGSASVAGAGRKLLIGALCIILGGPSRPAHANDLRMIGLGRENRFILLQAQQQTGFQRGLLALQENHFEAALEEFTAAEREQPENATIRNFRGIVLAQLGRSAEATAEYREAIRMDPGLEMAYRNLGFLEWNDHQLDAARQDLQSALKLVPGDAFASYYLARVELELQQYHAAFDALERSGMPLPDDPDVLTSAARGYLALGRQQDARTSIDRAATHTLTQAQTSSLASLLLAVHESDIAIHLLQRSMEQSSPKEERWASFDLGLAYLLAGDYRHVADQEDRCTVEPHSIPATLPAGQMAASCSLLGIAHAHLGHGDQAVEAFRRSTSLAPEREEHWLNLTRELMELSRFTQAISTTEEAIRIHPDSYALHLRLGAADLAVDRYKDAEFVFRQLILAGDPLPTSSIGLAQVLLRTGRAAEAVLELAAAGKRLGPSFLLSYFQGLALNRAGRPSEAASAFREALQQNPESGEAHSELGKTELKLAHFDQSIAELQAALHLNPADAQARRLLQQAYHRSGKPLNNDDVSAVVAPARATEPAGDFVLPDWQEPGAENPSPHNAPTRH